MLGTDNILILMMLIPAGVCVIVGIILQIAASARKKRIAIGPVLIAAGIIFAAVGIVTIISLS